MRQSAFFVFILLLFFPLQSHSGQIGLKAPALSLRDLRGNTVTLEQYTGTVVILVFWASWCRSCKEELSDLKALSTNFRDRRFSVVAVNVDDAPGPARRFLAKMPVTFPVLIDETGSAGDAYLVTGLPTTFLIGKDGTIHYRHAGYGKEYSLMYESVTLSSVIPSAHGVVLYFTMWCPICDMHMSNMRNAAMPQYPDVRFFLVDFVSGTVADALSAEISSGYAGSGFTVLADVHQTVLGLYQATMGTTVVIDSGGIIRMNEDYNDGSRLRAALSSLP
jgi:peroxiredoxin